MHWHCTSLGETLFHNGIFGHCSNGNQEKLRRTFMLNHSLSTAQQKGGFQIFSSAFYLWEIYEKHLLKWSWGKEMSVPSIFCLDYSKHLGDHSPAGGQWGWLCWLHMLEVSWGWQCQPDPWMPSQCAVCCPCRPGFCRARAKTLKMGLQTSVVGFWLESLLLSLYTGQQFWCAKSLWFIWGDLGTAWEVPQNEYEKGCSGKAFVV